jgi:hypothetical protein
MIRRFLRWRERRHQMAWGLWTFRLPFGIKILCRGNGDMILWVARHPQGSITWTWFIGSKGCRPMLFTQKAMWANDEGTESMSEAIELRKRAALLRQAEVEGQMPGDVLIGLYEILERAAVTISQAEKRERNTAEIADALDTMRSMSTPDIPEIQRQHEERLRATRRWIVAETEEGFEVHEWSVDGVAPWAEKATKEEAAARLIQLMGIKHAIIPQAYPERVCIGSIVTKDEP